MRLDQILTVGTLALVEVGHGIDTEPIDALLQPEGHHVQHSLAHIGVVVVEVRLRAVKPVPVKLLALRIVRPVRVLCVEEDDTGLGVALIGIAPHVPVAQR